MDTEQLGKVSTFLPLHVQKIEICFTEYKVKLNPKLIKLFKKVIVHSLDRISNISTIQYLLRYVEDKKVTQWLSSTLDLSAHWYHPVEPAFDLINFSAAFYVKWDYLSVEDLWLVISLILPVLLMVLISPGRQTANRTHSYWLFSLVEFG